jgi:tRNA(Ile)-lysidine synthase
VCVAFSGGLDSSVLLHLFSRLPRERIARLRALHIHHGLSPNADAWAQSCARFCDARGAPLQVERVQVQREGEGLEAAARRARYAVFERCGDDAVALAHHRDDQVETVMLQLFRGTGLKGAAGMPEWRSLGATHLFRPLLGIARAELLEFARHEKLEWIEDESNARTGFDRNYLRHEIAPLLDARFPAWRASVARFARHAAVLDAETRDGVAFPHGGNATPSLVLRSWLCQHGLPMPSEAKLHEMVKQLQGAAEDAQVRIEHAGVVLRRYRGEIHIERASARDEGGWRVPWHGESDVALGESRGAVRFETAAGAGLAVQAVQAGDWYFAPRAGGERLRLRANGPARTLKNLLQEHAVPPWERERLPLLFHEGRLVWAPGIGLDSGYACAAGAQGLKPCWRVAGKAPLC